MCMYETLSFRFRRRVHNFSTVRVLACAHNAVRNYKIY